MRKSRFVSDQRKVRSQNGIGGGINRCGCRKFVVNLRGCHIDGQVVSTTDLKRAGYEVPTLPMITKPKDKEGN